MQLKKHIKVLREVEVTNFDPNTFLVSILIHESKYKVVVKNVLKIDTVTISQSNELIWSDCDHIEWQSN